MWNDIFELKLFDWVWIVTREDFGLVKMFRVAFTKVGAILCALKGISSE